MMQRTAALALLLVGAVDAGAVGRAGNVRGHGFLSLKADMQPDVVAHTLVKVEDEWNFQVASFAECNMSAASVEEAQECDSAPKAFKRSCSTVVNAVVKASSGDKADVAEYMSNVCDEEVLKGWRGERCQSLAVAIKASMSDDAYDNREHFSADSLCTKFWLKFSSEEGARLQKEKAEREAQEKKEAEERAEAEKKEEEERLAAEKKAAEEAAAEAAHKKQEEEAAAAEEAKKQAEEAAAKLAEKNAEAQRVAEEAEKKLQEASVAAANVNTTNTSAQAAPAATDAAAPAATDATATAAPAADATATAAPAATEAAAAPAAPAVLASNATVANDTKAAVAAPVANTTNATVAATNTSANASAANKTA